MKATLALLLALCANIAMAQDQEIKQRYAEVMGNAKIEVTPDIAHFAIVVKQNAKENIDIAKQEQEIVKILKKHQVPTENLTIDKISGLRQKVNVWGSRDMLAQKSFMLKLTDLSQADDILNEISALKVNTIALRKLENSNIEKYKLDACKQAAKNAKDKASYMAQGMGSTLLAPLTIYEQDLRVSGEEEDARPIYRLKMSSIRADEAMEENGSDQQDFKNIVVNCSVRAKFEIKDAQ